MNCPNCRDRQLRPVLTRQGSEVDYCDNCHGVWLDKGEIYQFAGKPKAVERKFLAALKERKPSTRLSPRTGKPMVAITYDGRVPIDFCFGSGGLWFDAEELRRFVGHEANVALELEPASASQRAVSGATTPAAATHALLALPNLFLRSTLTLALLYTMLGIILIAAVEFAGVEPGLAVAIGIAIILLQFLLGPFVMDLSLRFLYRMEWVEPDELPKHLQRFIRDVCADNRMKYPSVGIINDSAPQAFTYGHTPNNARVVISRGILELLDEPEAEAVVAHELGHAVHWDMALMTVAQLVPLLLYYVYRSLIEARSRGRNDRGGGARLAIAVSAYVLYIISQYVVLWFSRTREYHADRFAGTATGNPALLASALVKIAYGLAGRDKSETEGKRRSANMQAIGAFGIFNERSAQAFAIAGYSDRAAMGELDRGEVAAAMRWDLWNPWARWYELNSTHPLVANRLRYLGNQALHLGQTPFVTFDQTRPESYWDEFATDIIVHLLPWLGAGAVLLFYAIAYAGVAPFQTQLPWATLLTVVGVALLVRFQFVYRGDYFPNSAVATLLKRVKVSAVRPIPCTVQGTVIGRGVPGYIFSEDFVLRDNTGIIFLDYRQPLGIWEFFFALLKAGKFQGKTVTVRGWYRRAPIPYVEIKDVTGDDGITTRSWVPILYRATAIVMIVVGIVWLGNTAIRY